MSLLWFDGFESYNSSADIGAVQKLSSQLLIASGQPSTDGRTGKCWQMTYNYYDFQYYQVRIFATPTAIIFGFALYMVGTATPENNRGLCIIEDSAGDVNLRFAINSSRHIEVYGPGDVLIGTSTGQTLEGNVWYYIEVKATIDNTAGAVEIKINETQVLSLTSKDTQVGSNSNAGYVRFSYPGPMTRIDDIYICDTSGSKNNDFLGDVRIDVLRPNAAGTYTDFTPSAGSNHENVDEASGPDDDTTYNDGANVGDQDSYQMPDLPTPAGTTIHGVKTQATVRKTDAGAMKCKLLTRAGTTNDLGDEIILSDSYTTHAKILENNPDDLAAWADADVNSMEPGVEITA